MLSDALVALLHITRQTTDGCCVGLLVLLVLRLDSRYNLIERNELPIHLRHLTVDNSHRLTVHSIGRLRQLRRRLVRETPVSLELALNGVS
jgi:hypothetical protein